jgi:hypothetical protein
MALSIAKLRNAVRAVRWISQAPACSLSANSSFIARFKTGVAVSLDYINSYRHSSQATENLPDYPFKLNDFERQVPFVKKSIWMYMSLYPYFSAAVYFIKDGAYFNRVALAMRSLSDINNQFFREFSGHYPFDRLKENPLSNWRLKDLLFKYVYSNDTGNNLFPSQHVSSTVLIALALHHGGYHRSGRALLLWSLMIAASTQTTKQHFQVDIIAALLLATKTYQGFFLKENEDRQIEEIKTEIAAKARPYLINLANYDEANPPGYKQFLARRIDPAIIAVMEEFGELNPFNPVYSEIISRTLEMVTRL